MIIPSIDIQGGETVQLVGGRDRALAAGDPQDWLKKFSVVGPVAIIDLDAATGEGRNTQVIESLLPLARCRVGGGIRDIETALHWLDAGAEQIIIGTAARVELLRQLPRERVMVALDSYHDEIVVEGWRKGTGQSTLQRIQELREFVGGFLVTFVEREGRMGGTRLETAEQIIHAAGDVRVTIAGGVSTLEEIAQLDRWGADAQVGMAIYRGQMHVADAFSAPLVSDREDGLWPTVVVNEAGTALGLVWSSRESLRAAIDERRGIYWSRKRGLWRKGETSGDVQELVRIDVDCDRDALRFTVRQLGAGFCHLGQPTCWGTARGLERLERTVQDRIAHPVAASYTDRLVNEPGLLESKLKEEARELSEARERSHIVAETADIAFFAAVKLAASGARWQDVNDELDRRSLKITRRPGNAKSEELE